MTTGDGEKYCLRWNDFTSNLSSAFNELRDDEDFFDITLITEESEIRCHKLILGACSPHFRTIIRRLSSVQNPAIYLRGVRHEDIKNILEFMYLGMVNVAQEDLDSFLSVAQDLCIKGLTQDGQQQQQQHQQASTSSGPSTPASTPIKYAPPPAKRAKLKSNGDNIIKSSVPKKEPKIDPEIIEEVPPADQGDSLEGYEDYYEAGPSDPGEDGKVEDDDNGYLEDMVALVDPLDLDPARFLQQSLSTQPVTCFKCGKILADRRNLERHLATAHQGEDARVECPFCRKTFKNKESMDHHRRKYHNLTNEAARIAVEQGVEVETKSVLPNILKRR